MGSQYHRKFSGKNIAEGNTDLLKQIAHASEQTASHKSEYDSGFMVFGAGGHAMTTTEILRKS